MSLSYFERVIYTELNAGLDELYAVGQAGLTAMEVFQAFVSNLGLEDEAEEQALVTNLVNNRPRIQHGYPKANTSLPLVSIVLADEVSAQDLLGDVAETLADGQEVMALKCTKTYNLMVLANNPDMAMWLYQIVRYILISRKRSLVGSGGLVNLNYSGGDINPMTTYLPDTMFGRNFRLVAEGYEEIALAPAPDTLIRSVSGAYLQEDSAGVDGGVTVLERDY